MAHLLPVWGAGCGHGTDVSCPCSECNSNRDSVLSYTSVRSNSSYLGSDEMGSGECTALPAKGLGLGGYFLSLLPWVNAHVLFLAQSPKV